MTSGDTLDVPLGDLSFFLNDPLPTFARMRAERPVYWYEPEDFYVLTRYQDVLEALRNPTVFSSAQGILRRSAGSEIMNELTKGTIASSDPPLHTRLRRKVSRGLVPRAINDMEPYIRKVVTGLLDRVEPGEVCDFVHDFAEDVPTSVLGELCGIPEQDHKPIIGMVDKTVMEFATNGDAVTEGVMELMMYLIRFVQESLDNPGDDLISRITAPDEDGERLEVDEILKFVAMLIAAGAETTRALLCRGMYDLARFPDQRDALLADRRLLGSAIEEMFRFGNPAGSLARVTTGVTTVRGVEIPADKLVLLMLTSANFDEEVFGADAHQFRIDRDPNPHLGLGSGIHYCLGAALARLEVRVFFEELLDRFTDWHFPEPPTPYPAFEFFNSFAKMPIVFRSPDARPPRPSLSAGSQEAR